MKTNPIQTSRLILSLAILSPWCACGQDTPQPAADGNILKETVEDEVSVATGTIFSVDIESISLTPEKSAIPLVFETTAETPILDEQEKPVVRDLLRKGIAATVNYTTLGKKLLATKITVTRETLTGSTPDATGAAIKRAELTETKVLKDEAARKNMTAEGIGTLMGFEQIISVRAPGEARMTQYTVNNSTLYVDSAGNPVPPHVVRTGVSLNVQFVEDAGRKIATKVVVQSMPKWVREGMLAAESATRDGRESATVSGQTRIRSGQTSGSNLSDDFLYPPIVSLPVQPPREPKDATVTDTQPDLNQPVDPNQADQPTRPNLPNKPNSTIPPNSNPPRAPKSGQPGSGTSPSTPSQPSTPPAGAGPK